LGGERIEAPKIRGGLGSSTADEEAKGEQRTETGPHAGFR
jgi:hypothetical protein